MSKGWECPKCGACYSPYAFECKNCKHVQALDEIKHTAEPLVKEIKFMLEELQRMAKEKQTMMIEQQSQFDLDGAEIAKLRADKARLIEAFKQVTNDADEFFEHYGNVFFDIETAKQLLTEMGEL